MRKNAASLSIRKLMAIPDMIILKKEFPLVYMLNEKIKVPRQARINIKRDNLLINVFLVFIKISGVIMETQKRIILIRKIKL